MLDWFYQDTDRGEQNISECKNIYDLVEKLQYRVEDLENEHMLLLRQMGELNSRVGGLETKSEWISNSGIVSIWIYGAGLLLMTEDQYATKSRVKEMICG